VSFFKHHRKVEHRQGSEMDPIGWTGTGVT
jgi:hypothetical protein